VKMTKERNTEHHLKNCSKTSFASSTRSYDFVDVGLTEENYEELSQKANIYVKDRFHSMSNYEFASERLGVCPTYDLKDLKLGHILGKGQFGVVTEVKRGSKKNTSELRLESAQYAIKMLDESQCNDRVSFFIGARDLAVEAYLMAAMDHPHILKLQGLSNDPLGSKNCFLMFDRLYGTLNEYHEKWRLRQQTLSRGFRKLINSKAKQEKQRLLLEQRLQVMRDLASAVAHLHEKYIIDRDLKPENVGFDANGNVKLFDFGLSTEVDPSWTKPYKLTGMIGSLAYMAPEVHCRLPYDETCDIYSLGLIFWKTLKLQPLFSSMSPQMLRELVVLRGIRPVLDSTISDSMQTLLGQMWHPVPDKRISASQVSVVLDKELALVELAR